MSPNRRGDDENLDQKVLVAGELFDATWLDPDNRPDGTFKNDE
jgi:hypothetical protein